MRYYKLVLTNDKGPLSIPSLAGSGMPPGTITSLLSDGVSTNPAALNIELDVAQYPGHMGGGDTASYLRIWGLSLKELAQSFNLNPFNKVPKNIEIYGGMARGYPLADPTQAGLLIKGTIMQAFGNWIGVDQTLDMYIGPPNPPAGQQGTNQLPSNFSFTWSPGQKLGDAIGATLSKGMPGIKQQITVSASRITTQAMNGVYGSFTQFAMAMRDMTKGGLGVDDIGVVMNQNGQNVTVGEGTPKTAQTTGQTTGVKQIKFQDLLGQVTWVAPYTMQAKLVMRGDLDIMDMIQFPESLLATTSANSQVGFGGTGQQNPSNSLTFNGAFQVTALQHWGNFRNPDAMSWNTTVTCIIDPTAGDTSIQAAA